MQKVLGNPILKLIKTFFRNLLGFVLDVLLKKLLKTFNILNFRIFLKSFKDLTKRHQTRILKAGLTPEQWNVKQQGKAQKRKERWREDQKERKIKKKPYQGRYVRQGATVWIQLMRPQNPNSHEGLFGLKYGRQIWKKEHVRYKVAENIVYDPRRSIRLILKVLTKRGWGSFPVFVTLKVMTGGAVKQWYGDKWVSQHPRSGGIWKITRIDFLRWKFNGSYKRINKMK